MSKLDELIKKVEYDVNDFKHPCNYENDSYYVKCEAKLDYAEEILSRLKDIKAEQIVDKELKGDINR